MFRMDIQSCFLILLCFLFFPLSPLDFIASMLCLLGYAFDSDIACIGDGEAIGNASVELSHMGTDVPDTNLFLQSPHRSQVA